MIPNGLRVSGSTLRQVLRDLDTDDPQFRDSVFLGLHQIQKPERIVFALGHFHFRREPVHIANGPDLHILIQCNPIQGDLELPRVGHFFAVERNHDVARLQTSFRRGPVGVHIAQNHAPVLLQIQPRRKLGRDALRRHTDLPAMHMTVFADLLINRTDHVARDGEADALRCLPIARG